jgi:hypothetical protein
VIPSRRRQPRRASTPPSRPRRWYEVVGVAGRTGWHTWCVLRRIATHRPHAPTTHILVARSGAVRRMPSGIWRGRRPPNGRSCCTTDPRFRAACSPRYSRATRATASPSHRTPTHAPSSGSPIVPRSLVSASTTCDMGWRPSWHGRGRHLSPPRGCSATRRSLSRCVQDNGGLGEPSRHDLRLIGRKAADTRHLVDAFEVELQLGHPPVVARLTDLPVDHVA